MSTMISLTRLTLNTFQCNSTQFHNQNLRQIGLKSLWIIRADTSLKIQTEITRLNDVQNVYDIKYIQYTEKNTRVHLFHFEI